MTGSLPKKLPPRREVDHTIELEMGSKPSAKAPYRMPPPELEELRNQLKSYWNWGGAIFGPLNALWYASWYYFKGIKTGVQVLRDNERLCKVGELSLPKMTSRHPFDGLLKKKQSMDYGDPTRVSSGIQNEFEEKAVMKERKRSPDRVLEPKVKRDEKEVHGARERDDSGCPLLEDLEALFVGWGWSSGDLRVVGHWSVWVTIIAPRMDDDVKTFLFVGWGGSALFANKGTRLSIKKRVRIARPLVAQGTWESVSMDFYHYACRSTGREWKVGAFGRSCSRSWNDLNFFEYSSPINGGQTERVNALLELYLRHYVSANQHDWAKLLDVAQFSYNMQRSEATGKMSFCGVTEAPIIDS
ncbi:putative nucleotidyltransferase, ribonuclease H [Tanacetum coccineum]